MKMRTEVYNLDAIGQAVDSLTMLGFGSIKIEFVEGEKPYFELIASSNDWKEVTGNEIIGFSTINDDIKDDF